MTDQTAAPTNVVRSRRDPAESAPRIAESDRPDPAELARARALVDKRRRFPVWKE